MTYAIGIDIGGTKTAIGLVDPAGQVAAKLTIPTLSTAPAETVANIADAIRDLLSQTATDLAQVRGIGIGAPGPLDTASGMLVCPPNLPGWAGFPLVGELKRRFNVPIRLENDATAAALGEKWIGAGRDSDHFVYLTISTGIGAGIYSHGRLITGTTGNAGDAGHIVIDPAAGRCVCGQDGCWEHIASGTAIAREASAMHGCPVSVQEAFALAEGGNPELRNLIDRIFAYFGAGCVTLINLFDPEKIVIGGGVSQVGAPLFDAVRDYVGRHALNPSGRRTAIVPAALRQDAGLIGAAALVYIPGDRQRKEPLFLEPVFKERIWGGTKLNELFGYDIPYPNTGECWAVSAHPNGQSVVRGGVYHGMALDELWTRHRDLFCDPGDEVAVDSPFPLLIKILDASDDLSVQVHPNDEYAAAHENGELGKTECWYVLDAEPDAEIIFGHRAQTREQFEALVRSGEWSDLLTSVKVRPGEFFYVPSGTLHALGKGIVVLETQQSSDTTYRVYDYERVGADGKLRELHLDKAIDVTNVPHTLADIQYEAESDGDLYRVTFVETPFFTVQKWSVTGTAALEPHERFLIVSVIDGAGAFECEEGIYPLRKGEHFILPRRFGPYRISGRLELMVSHAGPHTAP